MTVLPNCPLQIQTHITDCSNTETESLIWKDELHMVVQIWERKGTNESEQVYRKHVIYKSKTE